MRVIEAVLRAGESKRGKRFNGYAVPKNLAPFAVFIGDLEYGWSLALRAMVETMFDPTQCLGLP